MEIEPKYNHVIYLVGRASKGLPDTVEGNKNPVNKIIGGTHGLSSRCTWSHYDTKVLNLN